MGLAAALLLAVVIAVVAFGSGDEDGDGSAVVGSECREAEAPQPRQVDLPRPEPGSEIEPGEPAGAVVETSCGSFTIELATEQAPLTANSFAYLARNDALAGTAFHRIAPGFVIQGGDPEGTGSGGPGYSIRETPPGEIAYEPGVVAMAKTTEEPAGTSGSQFFVVTGEGGASLTPEYALAGRVTEGMDVVEAIGELGGPDEQPQQTVLIESVTIREGDGANGGG